MKTTILICSKDPVMRQAAADAVAEGGFGVGLARDGYEALDQFDVMTVKLVVLDLDDSGKDAWDLVEWLLENQPLMPIVFLTSVRESACWAGTTTADVKLEKPVQAARLVAAVRRLLDEPPSQRLSRSPSQRMALRYSRPYVGSASTGPAYSAWGLDE